MTNTRSGSIAATHLLRKHHAPDDWDEYHEDKDMCAFCGHDGVGAPVDEVVSQKYFSDYPLMQADTGHVCNSCAYAMNTRMLKQGHWLAHSDGLLQPSTGDLLEVFRDLVAGKYDTPLAVHVTSSPIRSSHAYLWTPVNESRRPLTVAFDRQHVRISDWGEFETLLSSIEDLRLHGFTFDEIRSCEPRVGNVRSIGREAYQRREYVIERYRRTAKLELALKLSRSDDDQERTDLKTDHRPLTV